MLISNELKIICKVLWNIYTPRGYRGGGGGGAFQWTVGREQGLGAKGLGTRKTSRVWFLFMLLLCAERGKLSAKGSF